ncbi:MAG: MerR family transcriptional regulator [Myxococcota bacterium]
MAGRPLQTGDDAGSFSLGAVVRLTGLTEHTIRAWERRYGAIRPARSAKGTRRYAEADVERLQLLRAAVDAGHRIGEIAALPDAELVRRLEAKPQQARDPLEEIRAAIERLDPGELDRLLGLQLGALGIDRFCRDVALPLLVDIGNRWEEGTATVASEHMLSASLRGLLGMALRSERRREGTARVLFVTPEGERHEFGVLAAALTAAGAGADVTYLGAELPVEEVVTACETAGASAVGLSVVTLGSDAARRYLEALRAALPDRVVLWVGGAGAPAPDDLPGVTSLDLDGLRRAVLRMR